MKRMPGKYYVSCDCGDTYWYEGNPECKQCIDHGRDVFRISSTNNEFVAAELTKQDAEYIVRAVNCHERLVEWVKLLREVHRKRGVAGVSKGWAEINELLAEAEGGEDDWKRMKARESDGDKKGISNGDTQVSQ